MTSYISRRRRWFSLLKTVGPDFQRSTTRFGDLFLETHGLSDLQQLVILVSTSNKRDFEYISEALLGAAPLPPCVGT